MEVIHKVNITTEAKFDVSEDIGLTAFDWRTLKNESEDYIKYQDDARRIPWWGYFRADYLDEDSGERLKLFFYKGEKLGLMQFWELKGICRAADWSEEAEDDGWVRVWLETKVIDLEKGDWVLVLRAQEKKKARLLVEAANENYGEDYTEMVKDLLKNYKIYKAKVALLPHDDPESVGLADRMEFLTACIEQLADDEGALIKDIYLNGLSISRAAKKYGYSKSGLHKKKDRYISVIEVLFADRFAERYKRV